jgi:biotin operon repressor
MTDEAQTRRVTAPGQEPQPFAERKPGRVGVARREALVTVESQRELDLFTGQQVERTFVKLYVAARRSGLLAAISDRDWKTLCTLATYMDAAGYCFPSQAALARAMGCSRQMANERIRNLAAFRFQGQAVLLVVKGQRSAQGTWAHNGYRVLPIARLRIYDQPRDAGQPRRKTTRTVSRSLDTAPDRPGAVSRATGTAAVDMKKTQTLEPEPHLSKLRRDRPRDTESVDTGGQHQGTRPVLPAGVAHIGTLMIKRPRPQRVSPKDEDYQVLQAYLADMARELGDRAPLRSSTTRAYNFYKRAGVSRAVMIERLFAARAILKDRTTTAQHQTDQRFTQVPTRNRAAYFFAVLEDELGLR